MNTALKVIKKEVPHSIKIESLEISRAYADQIEEALNDFLDSLNFSKERIEGIECRTRDGFFPYSHNKGGLEASSFIDQSTLMGMGYETYFKNLTDTLTKYEGYDLENFLKSKGLTEMDWENEELSEEFSNVRNESEDTVMMHVKCMLTSESSVDVTFEICAKDSPYHRQYDEQLSITVDFKKIQTLKNRLKKITARKWVNQFKLITRECY